MEIIELLKHLHEAAYVVDADRKIHFWNAKCEAITGYKSEEVIGSYCYDNILRHVSDEGRHLCHDGCPLLNSLKTDTVNEAQVYLHHKEGFRVPVKVRTIPYYDELTQTRRAIEVFSDVQDEDSLYHENKKLTRKASLDALTGLFNRDFMDYQINASIKEANVFDYGLGLLFIDIDHFKAVNDTYGHDVGDEVLKKVAKTIERNVRESDFTGRFGGEEFVVLLRDVTKESMVAIAGKLRILVQNTYIFVSGKPIHVTVSIGCTMYAKGESKDPFIKRADANMYEAKKTGRNKVIAK